MMTMQRNSVSEEPFVNKMIVSENVTILVASDADTVSFVCKNSIAEFPIRSLTATKSESIPQASSASFSTIADIPRMST